MTAGRPRRIPSTPRGQAALALALYAAASVGFFGLPVLAHPGTTYVGWGTDPSSFVWYFAWWPYALGHGLNPLFTHEVWAPAGFNLAHATSIPGPALLLAPITLWLGPVVAYNLAALAAPAVAAWSAYLLCRYLTGSFWPSLFGGYLFGFSTYLVAQMLGHLNLTLVFALPLLALAFLRRWDGAISAGRFVLEAAALLVALFACSVETFATATLFGGFALLLAWALAPSGRRRTLGRTAGLLGAAYAVTGIVAVPFLVAYANAAGHVPIYEFYPSYYVTDAANLLVPTSVTGPGSGLFASASGRFTGDLSEQGAYVGLPLAMAVAAFVGTRWGSRRTRFLLAFAALAWVLSLGPRMHVLGKDTVWMPWSLALRLPLLRYALPARLTVYLWLAVAVAAALWFHGSARWWRWPVAALAVAALAPNLSGPFWHNPLPNPRFFASGAYRQHLGRGDNVLVVPYGAAGHSMYWQAETGFWFRMPEGNVGVRPPPEFGQWPIVEDLYGGVPSPGNGPELLRFLAGNDVRAVVVVDGTPGHWNRMFAPMRTAPHHVDGARVYRVPARILGR